MPAYFLFRLSKGRLSFPLIAVGSVIADLEIPTMFILTDGTCAPYQQCRLVFHSFLGAATLGAILTILTSYALYPALSRRFLKLDANLPKLLSGRAIISSMLGALTHPFVDMFHHSYNPILFPMPVDSVGVFVLTGDVITATIIMHALFSALGLMILYWERANVMFYLSRLESSLRWSTD